MKRRALVPGLVLATTLVSRARAEGPEGFAVDRLEPAERGSAWLVTDDLDFRRRARPTLGATVDFARKTLVARDAAGEERAAIVRTALRLHLGGAWVLGERLRLGVSLPLALAQHGQAARVGADDLTPPSGAAFGDVRLAADLRVAGARPSSRAEEARVPLALAAGVRLWLPTGSRAQFTSDGTVRVGPQLLVAGDVDRFAWAARAAFVARPRDASWGGLPLGSEIELALGAGVHAGIFTFGPELVLASRVRDRFLGPQTAAELLVGAHAQVTPELRASLGLGTGLTPGFGAPAARGLLVLAWGAPPVTPPPPPAERDDDAFPEVRFKPPAATPPDVANPPLAVVTASEIRIAEQVRFATDSAELLGESDVVLAEVAKLLLEHGELRRVRVEGHTDDVGDLRYNEDLSRKRAEAVVRWLVTRGVPAERLVAEGYGASKPLVPNTNDEARAVNRRVVFTILERGPR